MEVLVERRVFLSLSGVIFRTLAGKDSVYRVHFCVCKFP